MVKRPVLLLMVAVATGAALMVPAHCVYLAHHAVEVTVKPRERYQVMTGWEVLARVWEYNKAEDRFDSSWYEHSDAIFDTLVNEIGINRVRLELRSGSENPVDYWAQFERGDIGYKEAKKHFYHKINDNADPARANENGFKFSYLDFQVEQILKPIMRRAKAKGEDVFVNVCFVDFKGGEALSDLNHALNPEEYAELVAAAFRYLKDRHGIEPDALEINLEPEHSKFWRGPELGAAAMAAVERLKAQGMSPEIILPSTLDASNAVPYFKQAIRVPGLAAHIGAISYHRYRGASDNVVRDIGAVAKSHGIRAEMLEYTFGRAHHIHRDLTLANASAWQLYSIAAPRVPGQEGASNSVLVYVLRDESVRVFPSHQGRYLAHYFRYVRMGARRIGSTTSHDAFASVAFENRDGGQVVVVNAETWGTIAVLGLRPGRYAAYYTTKTDLAQPMRVERRSTDNAILVEMPAAGVFTVFPADVHNE